MKYKRLYPEELQELEKEFVNFLASAQITGTDWEKMKEKELDKVNELIDVFSDFVYDKVLRKIKFLEFRDAKTLNIFNCTEEKIKLLGIRVNESSDLDLTAPDVLSKWNESNSANVTVVRTEKNYVKERELEMFELLQTGCIISNDRLYNMLRGMI
jgi:hypothetical protein